MPVEVVTFGCRLNAAESETMRAQAEAAGRRDLAIVNTCAVTAEAVRQGRQAIRRMARQHPGREILATGCAAEIERAAFAAMPEVTRVIENARKLDRGIWLSELPGPADSAPAVTGLLAQPGALPRQRTRAFVPVQNGCDHRCTFCVIPFGRGNSRSLAPAAVIEQVAALVDRGTPEVVLTGVDITSYGRDLEGRPTLGSLVRQLLREAPELRRLRLSSVDSVEVDPDLEQALAEEERLMPHLHLSLQSGDDLVLKRMKRRHSRADAIRFCAEMRRLRPEIVFGADSIVGFPTESEAMFSRSLDLVEECGLTHLHVFPFSPRPETPAARMPPVPGKEVQDRARRLRAKGEEALANHLSGRVGTRQSVLAEKGGTGRAEDFTLVRLPARATPGRIIELDICGEDGRALLAA